jgi:arginine decarboxylase
MSAWDKDEFVLDRPGSRCPSGAPAAAAHVQREQLMDRHGVQISKTSRNSVFMTNIGTTRSSVAFLVDSWSRSPGA